MIQYFLWISNIKYYTFDTNPWLISCEVPTYGYNGYNLSPLHCTIFLLTIFSVQYQAFQANDSNSKVIGNGEDLLVDDTTIAFFCFLGRRLKRK